MGMDTTALVAAVTAIGALGTAAFGLVDATKVFSGGVSRFGFDFIEGLVNRLAPNEKGIPHGSSMTATAIVETLHADWLNGVPAADFKSTVKSLIKLRLNPTTAEHLAKVTGVDPTSLEAVATALNTGATALNPDQMNTYARFDLLLSTLIDRAYQRADQKYRNAAKFLSAIVAVLLAEIAALTMYSTANPFSGHPKHIYLAAMLAGLLATPLAPVAKDLATGLNTAAKAVQSVKG